MACRDMDKANAAISKIVAERVSVKRSKFVLIV